MECKFYPRNCPSPLLPPPFPPPSPIQHFHFFVWKVIIVAFLLYSAAENWTSVWFRSETDLYQWGVFCITSGNAWKWFKSSQAFISKGKSKKERKGLCIITSLSTGTYSMPCTLKPNLDVGIARNFFPMSFWRAGMVRCSDKSEKASYQCGLGLIPALCPYVGFFCWFLHFSKGFSSCTLAFLLLKEKISSSTWIEDLHNQWPARADVASSLSQYCNSVICLFTSLFINCGTVWKSVCFPSHF